MGLLVEGKWVDQWYDTKASGGAFKRSVAQFRNWIKADGSTDFAPESSRYHLYVSHACPWAHRTLIYRQLKGLANHISVSVVSPYMLDQGWTFDEDFEGVIADPVNGAQYMHQVYTAADAGYSGRVTVPVLWDKKLGRPVSNESSEIIRMFDTEFAAIGDASTPIYAPADLLTQIDAVNERIYHEINNGVYKCGFATSAEVYEREVKTLFEALDWVEGILASQPYLVGDRITEADWRLFTTLVRFDPVYVGHFKCNLKRIFDYPNIWNYMLELAQHPGVMETINLDHIKTHYYASHETINPTRIVPTGPLYDLSTPHNRGSQPRS